MKESKMTVAKLLLEQLKVWGVKRIYGVVGDAIIGLMDEIANQSEIKFIAVKHESVAAMMASAEAKLTGNLGVCLATMGPGLGNLLNGLGDANLDKSSVLAITGQAPTSKIGTDYKQYIDQQELIKPFASYSTLLAHPDAITNQLVKAMHCSLAKGAVTHLSIPKDLFTTQSNAQVQEKPLLVTGELSISQKDINQVTNLMENAKHPMILAGVGTRYAVDEVTKLAEKWGAGILVSFGAKGYFSNDHTYLVGGIGQGGNPLAKELFKKADVVLIVGSTWWPDNYVPTTAKIIQIDNTVENIGGGIPVKIGVIGDAKNIVRLLSEGLKQTQNDDWVKQCLQVKEKWNEKNDKERATSGGPLHPARIVKAINDTVASDAIISVDTGDVTVWVNRNFKPVHQTFLFSGTWRTMGFGLPAAMAAKLVHPTKQVIAVVGDGGLEMSFADLLTAVRYEIDITVVVFNNHSLQMEKDKMVVGGYEPEGVSLTNPDFVQIAKGCGLKGFEVKTEEELEKVIAEALTFTGPVLVSVETAPVIHPETK